MKNCVKTTNVKIDKKKALRLRLNKQRRQKFWQRQWYLCRSSWPNQGLSNVSYWTDRRCSHRKKYHIKIFSWTWCTGNCKFDFWFFDEYHPENALEIWDIKCLAPMALTETRKFVGVTFVSPQIRGCMAPMTLMQKHSLLYNRCTYLLVLLRNTIF